jgi:predicted CXXCH cytochrome family protein
MFRFRQVSQRISGGEIVRERDLGPGPIRIGRGTDCEIEVPDLAVGLLHAVLRADERGQVWLEPGRGAQALLDGSPADTGPVALDRPRILALGRWRLRIETDPDAPGAVLLTLDAAGEARPEPERVTPPLTGRRMASWVLAVVIVLGFLAWPILSHALRPLPPTAETAEALDAEPHFQRTGLAADLSWNSGPLSGVHHRLIADCKACHQQPFVSVTDATCRSCHVSAHEHGEPARILASMAQPPAAIAAARAFANLPPGRCTVCHTEHEGPVLLSNPATSDCAGCHAALDARLPDTALLNASDWMADHPQFRPLVVAGFDGSEPRLTRLSLDRKPEDRNGLVFSHAQHLSRRNAVARMAVRLSGYGKPLGCGDCHRAEESGIAFLPIEMERDCGACHGLGVADATGRVIDLPHAEPEKVVALMLGTRPPAVPRPAVAGGARVIPGPGFASPGPAPSAIARARAPFLRGGACHDCHEIRPESAPGRLDFGIAPVHLTGRFYLQSQFPHAAHDDVRCGVCHEAAKSERAEDLLLPAIATCRECHGNAEWAARHPNDTASGDCATCHWFHPDSRAPSFAELEKRVRNRQLASR